MKIRTIKQIEGTNRDVLFTGGNSQRFIIESDNMGFAMMKTNIKKSRKPYHWHYPYHLEACYCISGKGMIESIDTGEVYNVEPGVCYILDKHDDHLFYAYTNVVLISVFNPPLIGNETHDEKGQYKIQTNE